MQAPAEEDVPGGLVRSWLTGVWHQLGEQELQVTTQRSRLAVAYGWLTLGLIGGYMAAEVLRWPF